MERSLKAVKSADRFSSQSSNSLQSINSILSDEANTSFLSYSSTAAAAKNAKTDSIHATASDNNKNSTFESIALEEPEVQQKDVVVDSASQSLTDILDNVRPPKILPPSVSRDFLNSSRRSSQDSLVESVDRVVTPTSNPKSSMIKLPGGGVLQKHVDVTRIDLERQQKVTWNYNLIKHKNRLIICQLSLKQWFY